eukprot:4954742-Prymnesium_polylepis.1
MVGSEVLRGKWTRACGSCESVSCDGVNGAARPAWAARRRRGAKGPRKCSLRGAAPCCATPCARHHHSHTITLRSRA